MKYAPASHASTVINGTLLVLTTLVGIHGLKEKTSRMRLLGVACSLCGIACMLAAKKYQFQSCPVVGPSSVRRSRAAVGRLYATGAAWNADALQAAAAVCVLSMLGYVPLYLIFAQSHIGLPMQAKSPSSASTRA